MLAKGAAALAVVLLLGVAGTRAQQVCNLDSNWDSTSVASLAFVGASGACPGTATQASVNDCSACICSTLALFQSGLDTALEPNATDLATGGFATLTDYINTCVQTHNETFADSSSIESGVSTCLSDAAFQSALNNSATNLGTYCQARFAPPGSSSPPTTVVDDIPPASETSGEESSAEFVPPSPSVVPVYPPVYPPGTYPPSIFAPPPSPGSGATLSAANLALQAAVAVVCLLASALLF